MSICEFPRGLSFAGRLMAVVIVGALTAGCPPKPPVSYPFVPMHEAIRRVNENNIKLSSAAGGLKASPIDASVRFHEREGGLARQFSFPGVLALHAPRDLILQLREGLGSTVVIQAGSNDDEYWLWVKPEINTLWWGTYPRALPETAPTTEPSASVQGSVIGVQGVGSATASSKPGPRNAESEPRTPKSVLRPESLEEMPIRPDDLIEVLGLSILPTDTTGPQGPVYRPEPCHIRNVLIFLEYDATEQGYIEKEYHLDQAPPYLVREIIFREPDGRVRMHAALSDDARVRGSDALAAHKIRIEWPSADSWLELRIRRFTLETEPFLTPENPLRQGITPARVIHVHSAADEPDDVAPGGAM
jgi:hypothetical protein